MSVQAFPNIEAERLKAGMSKAGMANAIGVKSETISRWQSGQLEIRASKIVALADLFGVSSDYLLGRTTSRNP